ncbi:hypothetical protein [Streptomyces sp. ATCC 21386]|uniref:hypothetical protein n=1 Tax=Streptomyces sp. ATCC 21386 TaxID=2699428 RepID=UPI001BFF3E6B|nr:hypothetical protein [Streptomyces sp. ATCC 21386]
MSGTYGRDRGEGGDRPGRLPTVAPGGVYVTYRAFTSPSYGCDECEYGDPLCPEVKRLWAAYVRARELVSRAAADPTTNP